MHNLVVDRVMKASEVVDILKSSIAATRESGVDTVSLSDLEAYAHKLSETASETPEDVAVGEAAMERYRAEHDVWISSRQQLHEHNLEMLRSVITVGQLALKSALLINGGAAIALLALVGQVWSSNDGKLALGSLATALLYYVFGVLSAAVAAGTTYISQAGYAGEFGSASLFIGRLGHVATLLGVIGAYVLFSRGSWIAFMAIVGG